jgi:FG-GAP-like repeat/FG-GAP repeat/PASTA domain
VKKLVALASVLALGASTGVAALLASSAPSFAAARSYVAGHGPLVALAPSFARARSYATGRTPQSVAIGDLNGDGTPDLVTANRNTISVLLNRGNGSLQVRRDYRIGGAYSVAIGDVNGDAKPDLAAADGGAVSVLLNRGDGSFQAKLDYATRGGPISVAIGDLNGDGKPDLASANYTSPGVNTVSVLLNRGDGSFQAPLDFATGDGPRSVAIGDLNGDGKPDLATANAYDSTVSVLLSRGDGSFRARRDYATGEGLRSVAIGDLNGDSKPDLATANSGHYRGATASVLLNRGDGSFRAHRDYGTAGEPRSVAIGDLNGDGKPDLATANTYYHPVSVLANKGDGNFGPELGYATGLGPESVAIGDLNGDGKPDLVTANDFASTVSVLVNTPGLCTVQNVFRQTLPAAKRTLGRASCRVGKIRRAYSRRVKSGRVVSQRPGFGAVLRGGGKVNLVVSRGRKHS